MNNNLTLERFIIWEGENSIGPEKKLETSGESNQNDTINKIKNVSVKNECDDTGKKKQCTKCNQLKHFDEFCKNSKSKDGRDWYCRLCGRERCKKYHNQNKNCRNEQSLRYYKNHKDIMNSYHRKYHKLYRQKPEIKLARNKKWKLQYYNDIHFRITSILRGRFKSAVKNQWKQTSVTKLIGCSIEQLKNHLECKFQKGMSWKNQGKWHIDHIKPCASFDLSKLEEQKKCFHYTNLQPLWAVDNLTKGTKFL